MNKVGMQTSQMFVYIVSIVIVGLTLLFGTQAILSWQEDVKNVQYTQLENQLKSVITDVASDYGSVKQTEIRLPGEYEMVCFFDLGDYQPIASPGLRINETGQQNSAGTPYPEIENAVVDKAANVFFLDRNSVLNQFYDSKILVNSQISIDGDPLNDPDYPENFVCIKRDQGLLKLRLEGVGRAVEVSAWPATS